MIISSLKCFIIHLYEKAIFTLMNYFMYLYGKQTKKGERGRMIYFYVVAFRKKGTI